MHTRQAESSAQQQIVALPAGLSLPLEVRVHGRGGQGGVTCAKLIALLYTRMGMQVQTFGDYGSERSGAPVQAYTRVDRLPINNHNKVYRPDHLIVLDEGLMGPLVLSGAVPGGVLLLNSHSGLDSYAGQYADFRFGVIDATAIAREHGIGSSSVVIINTTMIGAYARLLGISLAALDETFAVLGLGEDLAAAEHAYARVQMRDATPGTCAAAAPAKVTAAPPVASISEHRLDFPADLKTGSWSNQSPLYREQPAPCNLACPAGNDVVGFIQALKKDGADAAAAILLRTQPLPSVCGRVCPAPCTGSCNRAVFDGAVNIRSLERWIGDHSKHQLVPQIASPRRRFAVIGGGPAGLAAAWQLALAGHAVTLHEAGPALGGVLRNGIPVYRLPDEVLQRDLARIVKLGVEVKCNSRLDRDALAKLRQDVDAVIVCTGLGAALRLGVEGEQLQGIEQGLDFLERVKRGPVALPGHVMVVGAGNTAMDCARSALRCGAASVRIVCREGEDMPAIAEEIEGAEQEGIRFVLRRQPVAFSGNGSVTAATVAEVEAGPPDELGRPGFIVTQRTSTIPCDKVIVAIGQGAGADMLPPGWRAEKARAWQGETPLNIWFAGDCATGEGTVTHAIGSGRRAALASLAGCTEYVSEDSRPPVPPAQILISHFDPAPPHRNRQLAPAVRRAGFEEIDFGPAGPEEAARCFSCGHCTHCDTCLVYCPEGVISRRGDGYVVDTVFCKGCGMCVAECPRSAMEMHEKGKLGAKP
ncbi:MAG: 2-oxoacid:acceptor oxidoreductase family protein [Rhodocyclales bacterium]|nr:2-oxoacid:acceptor oxidoreductase family protein [Rhodocyclales bacterium]